MALALELARTAAENGDIPVGAIVVRHRNVSHASRQAESESAEALPEIIGRGANRRQRDGDPTAHAEILALRAAGQFIGQWQLTDCDLYVTLEPCPMCAGALVNARIRRVIFGCPDPKAGAVETLFCLTQDVRLNHRVLVTSGLCALEASKLLKEFFAAKRKNGPRK
jgi:tRNA(adenine34) deaminase